MKSTTLIKYLRGNNRIITMVNELYGTEISEGESVHYREPARSGSPGLMNTLCCQVGDKVIIVSEEKYYVHHFSMVNMMNTFQKALMAVSPDLLKDVDVYYIILDGSAATSLEPMTDMNNVAHGYDVLNLAGNHADVFDITYDEEHMPYALEKSKTLRDYAAWALAGRSILANGGIPYSMYEELSRWAKNQACNEDDFEPYAFAEKGGIISQAFDEWELEAFIQQSRNEAFLNGCSEEQLSNGKANDAP